MERGRRNVPKSLSTVYQQVKSWAYDLSRVYQQSIPGLQRPITGHIGVQNTKSTEVQRRNAPAPPHPGTPVSRLVDFGPFWATVGRAFPGQRRWTSVAGVASSAAGQDSPYPRRRAGGGRWS